MSEPYQSPPLTQTNICGANDNPHEWLSLKCSKCFETHQDCRKTFQDRGWRIFYEESFPEHDGFPVCQKCSDWAYAWEDLY